MAQKRRNRRRRRNRRILAAAVTAAALLLAVTGVILWMAFDVHPEMSVENYPVAYEELIRRYAGENELPPAYVASVILAESSYLSDAVSSANAQGLMQLLPDTGDWIAGKFGETYEEGCLFDPETNIKYGCWYLGFLMRRYGGDMTCASSAYHQGQGTVDKWLQNPEYSADGVTLTAIPSNATDTYVKRILRYYEKYSEIYAKADAEAA